MKKINVNLVSAWLRTAGAKAESVVKAMAAKAAELGISPQDHAPVDPPAEGDPGEVNANARPVFDWLSELSEVPADCGEAATGEYRAAQADLGRLLATALKGKEVTAVPATEPATEPAVATEVDTELEVKMETASAAEVTAVPAAAIAKKPADKGKNR